MTLGKLFHPREPSLLQQRPLPRHVEGWEESLRLHEEVQSTGLGGG